METQTLAPPPTLEQPIIGSSASDGIVPESAIVTFNAPSSESAVIETTPAAIEQQSVEVIEDTPKPVVGDGFEWSSIANGRFKGPEDIEALVQEREELASKISNPRVQAILDVISDPERVHELAQLTTELTTDWNSKPALEIYRAGWEQENKAYFPTNKDPNELFEEHLREKFSITDPDDHENGYGSTSGNALIELNAKVSGYRNQFLAKQEEDRKSLSEILPKQKSEPESVAMTPEQIEAQILENRTVLEKFAPDFNGVPDEIKTVLASVPQADWVKNTAAALAEDPSTILGDYISFVDGVPKYNMERILQDRYKLDHYDKHIAAIAAHSAQLGKAQGSTAIVQKLQNPAETPSLATQGSTPQRRSPTGAPPPTGLS